MTDEPTAESTDDEHEVLPKSVPEWQQFETDVAALIQKFDPGADVVHNFMEVGVLSSRTRQVDVLVTGSVGGEEIKLAIECKRYAKKIGIGKIDEFVGKLHDLNVNKGVIYALNGFTEGAIARAKGAMHPMIRAQAIEHVATWDQIVSDFTGFGDCPNDNCYTGDIRWGVYPPHDLEGGTCAICGTMAVRCPGCGSVNPMDWNQSDCYECGQRVDVPTNSVGEIESITPA